MSITLEIAKQLPLGQELQHVTYKNADGTLERWRVNGKAKTWKRDSGRVEVPLKRGLREYGYLTERSLDQFNL